jgi:hypothetical protein
VQCGAVYAAPVQSAMLPAVGCNAWEGEGGAYRVAGLPPAAWAACLTPTLSLPACLGGCRAAVPEEASAVFAALGILENMIEVKPEVADLVTEKTKVRGRAGRVKQNVRVLVV